MFGYGSFSVYMYKLNFDSMKSLRFTLSDECLHVACCLRSERLPSAKR